MSDSNMGSLTGLVVGTAGHIDHGKTSLIYALTGIDTDRLKEEKQRGISIDLGFAQMQMSNGRTISFVDVPGHERFVRNMLAGAAGMEAVMLIVAANDSVMPQTREHFEICRLLGLKHGVIVLTKADIATADEVAQSRRDVQQLVAGSFLAGAPVVEVSSLTKVGLDDLKRQLAVVASRETGRDSQGVARMPIDRGFAVKGFGTVVTGTLQAGSLSVGETLEVFPQKTKVRVRGLQAQHSQVSTVNAGQRVAVNLAGIEQQDVKRGCVLASAGLLAASDLVDVELNWLDTGEPPSPRELFVIHAGTSEVSARISKLSERFARLRLQEEIVVLPGDRFVIRRPSPARTVGGGVVIDAFPPKRMNKAKSAARLGLLRGTSLGNRLELLLGEAKAARSLTDLVRCTGASRSQVMAAVARNEIVLTPDDRAVAKSWIDFRRRALLAWLGDFHGANQNAAGAPLSSARMGLDPVLAGLVFEGFDAIRVQGETVSLTTHKAQFTVQEVAALQKMEQMFRAAGFQPPGLADALAAAGLDAKKARALLEVLVKSNRLVRLPDDLIFHAETIKHLRTSLAQHKGRKFSVVEFKSWTNISRKFAIPLLEYLDQQRVTKREGEVRVVL